MITCRRAAKEDVSLFREVRLRALKESPEAFGSTYEGALARDWESWEEQLLSMIDSGERNLQFAFEGEACVGIAALNRELGALSGDLIMMWVDPSFRGSEAASLLVENLMSWAKEVGFEEVRLGVTDSNGRAIRFYEKIGFVASGEEFTVDEERGLMGIWMTRGVV